MAPSIKDPPGSAVRVLDSPLTGSRRAVRWLLAAVVLEVLMVMPFVDHLADAHPIVHFTQHGLIFLGGVMVGIAIREAHLHSAQ